MNEYKFDEIKIGQKTSFSRTFNEGDAKKFAELTGDFNPLHTDKKYAKTAKFGGVIIHGMLAGSLFSALVGMRLPGKYCLLLSQELQFRKPIKPGQKLTVYGKILNKIEGLKILEIETKITDKKNNLLVTGSAKVKLLK